MSEENYNKQSVVARKIVGDPNRGDDQPGDFFWEVHQLDSGESRYLYICLPGEKSCSPIKVKRGAPGGERVWGWDGNEDVPTVEPSIHWQGYWHGHLRNGQLTSC